MLVSKLADECTEEDIPLLVESVGYPTAEETNRPEEFSKRKPDIVIEAARMLTKLPIDVLKSEFPADVSYESDEGKLTAYCRELSQASQLPWVLLSAGASFDRFRKEVEIACKNGASGFMAGRALWQEATRIQSRQERLTFFRNTTVSRLKELVYMADTYGTTWYRKIGSKNGELAQVTKGWYQSY